MALSCKLRLARFSAELRFQDRAECGNYSESPFDLAFGPKIAFMLVPLWVDVSVVMAAPEAGRQHHDNH